MVNSSSPRPRNPWWRELLYVAAFYAAYSLVRNLFGSAAVSPEEALANALRVVDVERFFGLYHEETIQGWFVSSGAGGVTFAFSGAQLLVQLWNVLYGTLHFVVTAGVLIWLYLHTGTDYSRWRNTLAFTTGCSAPGTRSSATSKRATTLAASVTGVKNVVNKLKVIK